MVKNFYEVLSVSRKATQKEIMERYRDLVRQHHPDRYEGEAKDRAEEKLQAINEAFHVLRDGSRRAQHDMDLDRPSDQGQDPAQLAKLYLGRGLRAYKTGNYIQAADNFDRATQAEPGNARAWHDLALTCFQEDRWLPKAKEAVEKAVKLKPNHAPYVKLAAKIFAKSGVTKRAKEYYNELLRLGGSDATVRQMLEAKGALGPKKSSVGQKNSGRSGLFSKRW